MSRFLRPHSSYELNSEEVNEQVPEMSITSFGRKEMHLDVPVEVGPRLAVPYHLISTYELDLPHNFVQMAPPRVCRQDVSPVELNSLTDRPVLCRENGSSAVSPCLPESIESIGEGKVRLNKTWSENDLKNLLACNSMKSAVCDKRPTKRTKNFPSIRKTIKGLKLDDPRRRICANFKKPYQETVLFDEGHQERTINLFEKRASDTILDCDEKTESLLFFIVFIVPNAVQIVIEVEKVSSKWDSESKLSNCKSYVIHSPSFLPRSYNPIIVQFTGGNLIRDCDLLRNYVFYHVMLQRFNDVMQATKSLCFQSNREEWEYRSKQSVALSAKYDASCFLFGNSCSGDSLIYKSEENLVCSSRITSPKNSGQKSKVRSSRTYTKVVHNWWDPTPPKKIKRYLSPDSITTEKSSTSGSETYWDFHDVATGHEKDTLLRKCSLTQFKHGKRFEALRPKSSESSNGDRIIKQDASACNNNLCNYYTFCSEAPGESIYEFFDSQNSFDEDSLNELSDSSISSEEVCWNNEVYCAPYSSKKFFKDIGFGDSIFRHERPRYCERCLEFKCVTGDNRTENSEKNARIYSEETTTIVEVEAHVSSESSSVHFQSTNSHTKQSQCISKKPYKAKITSCSVEKVKFSTKNQFEFSDNIFDERGSLKSDYRAHRSFLPKIENVKAKSNRVLCVSNNEINHKPSVSHGYSCPSVNSSFSNSKCSSKLPILQCRQTQDNRTKTPHWTSKTFCSKQKSSLPNKTLEGVNKKGEYNKTSQDVKAFHKAPFSKNTKLCNFPRKLSPIAASESVSCSKSFSSERSSGYDNVNTSFIDELGEVSYSCDDSPYEIEIDQSDNGEYCVHSERRAFLTCRIPKERTSANQFVLPDISVEKNNRKTKYEKSGLRCKKRMKFPNAVKEVVSRIANKKNNQSELEPYDLYKSAEEQMMKLLEPEKETPKPVSSPETSPTPVSPPIALSSSFTSDNSAFTKFTPIETPSSLFITEDDHANEADVKSHRSSEKSDSPLTITYCDNQSRKDSNENPISLSTLSLCSSVSIESVDSNKNGYRMSFGANSAKVEKKTPVPLRRSVSAFESRNDTPSRKTSKGRDPAKNRLKMEDMLYGSSNVEGERYFGSELANSFLHDSGLSSSSEKPVSDLESLNSAEQELLKSMSEFEKVFCSTTSSPDQSSQPLKFPSLLSSFPIDMPNRFPDVDQQHGHSGTNGTDSAYSSLNRKSPVGGEREEGGARFCHECGAKYPLAGAKFCCQCGVRRLIL